MCIYTFDSIFYQLGCTVSGGYCKCIEIRFGNLATKNYDIVSLPNICGLDRLSFYSFGIIQCAILDFYSKLYNYWWVFLYGCWANKANAVRCINYNYFNCSYITQWPWKIGPHTTFLPITCLLMAS